jgi:peptidoglycan hydrolase-like protein with peptidoglycan-binding domain
VAPRLRKLRGVEQWFQNTRGLVIVVLAVLTGAVLLAVEPSDGFPTGVSSSSGGDTTVTTTVTTAPQATTTTAARPTLQEGSTGADVTVLQQRLNALGYNVGNADGTFGPGTKEQVVKFQTDKGITPADGVVNAATWDALSVDQSGTTTTTTTAAQ